MALFAGILCSLLMPTSPAVAAVDIHHWAIAYESSAGPVYTGVRVHRLNRTVFLQASDGCSDHFSGSVVYQSQWLDVTTDKFNWLELGTAHQCNDTNRYYYWGLGYGGGWFALGTQGGVVNETSHYFAILRSGGAYHFYIDGVDKGTEAFPVGVWIKSGLESWTSGAVVGTYPHETLQRAINNSNTWVDWAGFDGTEIVGGGVYVCGAWNSATSWRVAENQPC
jgi:hypothetical protein